MRLLRVIIACLICLIAVWAYSYVGTTAVVNEATTQLSGRVMTIDYAVTVGHRLKLDELENVKKIIDNTFKEVNAVYNKWNPHSELSQLNRLKTGEKHHLTPALARLLQITDEVVRATSGRFDPTIEPLQQLWKQCISEDRCPSPDEIANVHSSIGWQHVHVEHDIFWKDDGATQLDLGGIAKGYAVDLLAERLVEAGYPNVLVEWGGEIRVEGKHPEGRPWSVGIKAGESLLPGHLEIMQNERAIATSGDDMQQWRLGDVTYFHILDPSTGQLLQCHPDSIATATVVAPTCALADGLATAAMMWNNLEEAQAWALNITEEYPTTRFMLLKH